MANLLLAIVFLLVLIKSCDILVNQATSLAKRFKVSNFIIGFVFVALGTSLPELIASGHSMLFGHPSLAISSIIGSNVVNLCLILGAVACYKGFKLSTIDAHYNLPLNFIATLLFIFIAFLGNQTITWISGVIMLTVYFALTVFVNDHNHVVSQIKYHKLNWLTLGLSLVVIVFAGKFAVENLLAFATEFGVGETVVGAIIAALITSLPEFITAMVAVRKGNAELGVGSIIGSNIFNLFFVIAICSFINPINLVGFGDELLLLAVATLSSVILALSGKRYYFSRNEGLVLLLFYLVFLYLQVHI
ncbi:sodium:calcium antiporter [bacterium]|nr:sodium:calcium antiporter [bacterium]